MPTNVATDTPTQKERRLLGLWCISTFFPAVGLFVYLPASTNPEFEHFSEEPHGFTAFLTLCLILSLGSLLKSKGPVFTDFLVRRMRVGSATATVFFVAYTSYVYSFSTLPPAPNAPEIGQIAPDFTVQDPEDRTWTLSEMTGDTLVFFYRGHW